MYEAESVSLWLAQLKSGEPDAARQLWDRYFRRLVGLARVRLRESARRAADEEDVALSAFDSFFRGVEAGRFATLDDRDSLWRLLVTITARKVTHLQRDQAAQKRGGGRVSGESVFLGNDASASRAGGIDHVAGAEPSPEFALEVAEQTRRHLEMLPDEQLRTIALARMEGYSNDEIATRLSVAPRTVERKLQLIREIWERDAFHVD